MTASTARIGRSLPPPGGYRFRLDGRLGEVEVLPAAHAHLVIELHDLAAAGALAADLVALDAVEDRRGEPEERHQRRDEEPQDERRPLDAADDPAGEAEEEAD